MLALADWIMPRLATVLARAAPTCTLWVWSDYAFAFRLRGPWRVQIIAADGPAILTVDIGRTTYGWVGAPVASPQ